ncbi:hypothetical protein [Truepera radiovictrix]|jgi:hypothetical protein|uniref:Uncharacterized protein n=1 Tax=Truepera radiovictrix (strain DSM 17093 / CIP 108686 / LMG 22925 / RQ-24) TaxID=649638 RepID=D7CSR5_TRURR|nr:hypothetical protein [Truepera radiovictrix]ADI13682.1 hypothetical protein Trad_0545 [Truepera radiovictrix DSM 17093]ADI13745.1 hypothetical protein Trad_0609 [Truepera radiovictrix DSM 17093]ADI13767.1 hypothetical protein Trad_0631 [Truepera radiovictrix DSM 17093]WMT57666.1 hypothetical protein RCV51_01660 [Truepera radiovictrix]WMT57690.1 hypothetical protein RCV51_01780 [Truepera radiovictrix]
MNDSTNLPTEAEQASLRDWRTWQAEHHARREAKGYNEPVSDEEALDILGLL